MAAITTSLVVQFGDDIADTDGLYLVAEIDSRQDGLNKGDRILVVDDLLATGGTVEACCKMVEKLGGEVVGCTFVIELGFLKGREKLKKYKVCSLINYESE